MINYFNYFIVFGCHLAIILVLVIYYYISGKNSNKARFYTWPFLITSVLLLIPLVVQAFIYKSKWFDFSDEIQNNNIEIKNYNASITSLESEIVNNPEKKEDQEKLISLSEKKKKTNIDMNNNYELQKLFRIVTIVAIVIYILSAMISWLLTPVEGPPIQLDPVQLDPVQRTLFNKKEAYKLFQIERNELITHAADLKSHMNADYPDIDAIDDTNLHIKDKLCEMRRLYKNYLDGQKFGDDSGFPARTLWDVVYTNDLFSLFDYIKGRKQISQYSPTNKAAYSDIELVQEYACGTKKLNNISKDTWAQPAAA